MLNKRNINRLIQDPYHYATSWTYSPLQKTQESDSTIILFYLIYLFIYLFIYLLLYLLIFIAELKKKELSSRGETLIIVPCWWDGSDERLSSYKISYLLLIYETND